MGDNTLPSIPHDKVLMPDSFEEMFQLAQVFVKSGLLPQSVKTAETALAIMLAGREMGLPPMQSFRGLYVVNGQVTMSAQHMAAKLIEAGVVYIIREMTADACEIEFRRSNGMHLAYRYTMEDAKTAQLTDKDNWKKFAKDMLYNRCMALGARKVAPDVLAGMYTPDEIAGASLSIDDEIGEIIDVTVPDGGDHEVEPEPAKEETAPRGWSTWSDKAHAAFWAKATMLRLHKDLVHLGFGVHSMTQYDGSMEDAKTVLLALDLAANKLAIGLVGLQEALGGRIPARAVADGMTFEQIREAVNDLIEAKSAEGEPVAQQGRLG